MNKKVSIVIPSWFTQSQHGKYGKHETFGFAAICLKLLLERTPKDDYELVVVDNGSAITDEDILKDIESGEYSCIKSFGMTEKEAKQLTPSWYWNTIMENGALIINKENLGFAKACNQGFETALAGDSRYIICMNNDIIVHNKNNMNDKNWLENLLEIFKYDGVNPPIGVVMPALQKQVKTPIESLGIDVLDLKCNYGKYGAGAEFGSCWAIPRDVMIKIKEWNKNNINQDKVFNEEYNSWREDRQLWRTVRLIGYDTYRTHLTRVSHLGNLSVGKIDREERHKEHEKAYQILNDFEKKFNI